MASEMRRRSLTRRRLLLGAAAIAVNALAACGGGNAATDTPKPAPATNAATPIPTTSGPAVTATPVPSIVAPTAAPTTIPTVAATPAPTAAATASISVPPVAETFVAPTGTPTTPLIVFTGDSLTYGQYVQRTETYPAQTIALLAPAKFDAVNLGISGDLIARLNTRSSETIDPLYTASRSKNIVVLWGGGNDLVLDASVEDAFARLVTFGQARRSAGFKVVMLTLIPRTGRLASMTKETFEMRRQGVNTSMRKNLPSFADALADVAADATFSTVSVTANREYYNVDETHLSAKGFSIIAPIVKAALLTL